MMDGKSIIFFRSRFILEKVGIPMRGRLSEKNGFGSSGKTLQWEQPFG